MYYLIFLILLFYNNFIFKIDLFCATAEEYKNQINHIESVKQIERKIFLSILDQRFDKSYAMNINELKEKLINILKNETNCDILFSNDQLLLPLPINTKIIVSTLGFYKTDSGTWCGKSVINIELHDPNSDFKEKDIPVSADIPFKKGNLKHNFNDWQNEVIEKTVKKLKNNFEPFLTTSTSNYRKVITIGTAYIQDSEQEAIKMATLDALRKGCAKAWGIQIESVTTMIDFADVEEIVKSKEKGLIVNYNILPQYTLKTDDGFICLVVEAVICNPVK